MQQIAQFWNDGYTIAAADTYGLDVDLALNQARKYIDKTLKASTLNKRDVNFSKGEINSFHALHHDPELMAIYKSSNILNLAETLFNEEVEIRAAELFAKPAFHGLPSPWHQDNFYWCLSKGNALTFWISCTQNGPLNGGVKYLAGTHKLGTLEHVDSNAPGSSQTVRPDLIQDCLHTHTQVTPALKIGDILVHHSNTIHGSDANHTAFPRIGLTIQVKTKADTYDQNKKRHYDTRVEAQIKSRVTS
jgi:phytanoyl-CoA hydroxylase